jgi:hypothetical protein
LARVIIVARGTQSHLGDCSDAVIIALSGIGIAVRGPWIAATVAQPINATIRPIGVDDAIAVAVGETPLAVERHVSAKSNTGKIRIGTKAGGGRSDWRSKRGGGREQTRKEEQELS